MKRFASKYIVAFGAAGVLVVAALQAQAPAPAAGRGQAGPGAPGGPGGGRGGGLPGATPEQTQAVTEMVTALAPLAAAVTTARTELATATFARTGNDAVRAATDKYRAALVALATARAEAFSKLQGGPQKLSPEQVAAFIAAGGQAGRGGGRGAGGPQPGGAGRPAGPGQGN